MYIYTIKDNKKTILCGYTELYTKKEEQMKNYICTAAGVIGAGIANIFGGWIPQSTLAN